MENSTQITPDDCNTPSREMFPLNKRRVLLIALFTSFGLLAGLWLVSERPTGWIITNSNVPFWVGLAAILVLLIYVPFLVPLVAQRDPLITLTKDGIQIRQGLSLNENIHWNDILNINMRTELTKSAWMRPSPVLTMGIENPKDYCASASPTIRRLSLRHNLEIYGTPVAVPLALLSISPDTLVRSIERMSSMSVE